MFDRLRRCSFLLLLTLVHAVAHAEWPERPLTMVPPYAAGSGVGSGGVGSAGQLAMELIKAHTGIELVHVPYKTGMQAIGDMANGQLDLARAREGLVER